MNVNDNITLIEDHHEALTIWRKRGFKDLTLVHIDAHIDFGFHTAKPFTQAIKEAKSVKELKTSLEQSLLFSRYEKNFEKQTNIGNYIYPAMREGIVRDFYWVIPGKEKEFKESRKQLQKLIKDLAKQDPHSAKTNKRNPTNPRNSANSIKTYLMGRRFIITTLEHLPVLDKNVLLDIDTDFLVINSIKDSGAASMIGKRKPWIQPKELTGILQEKIRRPKYTTIAYSVKGGFTPMIYKHLGDETAYSLAPHNFNGYFKRNLRAAEYFNLFYSTGKKEYYDNAIRLRPDYRTKDNNYGFLYLNLGKFSKAEKEFSRIVRADPKNPYALAGLGNIYREKRNYMKAKRYFDTALKTKKDLKPAILGLARMEFKLDNLMRAKRFLKRYQKLKPLDGLCRSALGDIYGREKRFERAVAEYKSAISLGVNDIDILIKLFKNSKHIDAKADIRSYVVIKYRDFKNKICKAKKANLKMGGKLRSFKKSEEKMQILEELIHDNS